ncbi:uncharacterized protein KY384_004368 [Bacidia gigantensis]|uniref:uncharacterized protein n=1 Tax=Bacidia gigantensis TaxID=2732470 RepID=UPI001D047946|nr:uncharacterized protein KY384_004368 [Bacidia gigantensis]KAG8531011.1 hypothetical protein KY384_004368 [Bacidia gigantensis]
MAPAFFQSWKSSSSSQPSPGSQYTSPFHSPHDESPSAYPGAKAEQLLGGPETGISGMNKKDKRKEKKTIRKSPSYRAFSGADTGRETGQPDGNYLFKGMNSFNESPKLREPDLRRQGSSPLLGNHVVASSPTADYFNFPGPPIARGENVNGLRSHKPQSKSPLIGSQDSSTPSPMSPPLPRIQSQRSSPALQQNSQNLLRTPIEKSILHTRKISTASKGSDGLNTAGVSQAAGIFRRRPSLNDPPTLYPEAPRAFHAVSPPPALINSSLPKPMRPADPAPKSFERPRWWLRNKSDRRQPTQPAVREGSLDPSAFDIAPSSAKLNIKKPKAGARNWFDGLDEDDVIVNPGAKAVQMEPEKSLANISADEKTRDPISPPLPMESSPAEPDFGINNSFLSERNSSGAISTFGSSPSADSRITSVISKPDIHSRTRRTTSPGKSLRSSASCKGSLAGIDLKTQSVLNLSSSDDEDEGPSTVSRELSVRKHRIRASVERADYGDDILVGNAQRVQPAKPRPIVSKASRRRSPRRSRTPDAIPPVPQVPLRAPLNSRNSSLRWRDVIEEKSSSTDVGGDSTLESGSNGETPLTTPLSARTSMSGHKKPPFRGSKLMKVTSEEERLLEAMREKRASIRASDIRKDDLNSYVSRPRTSGASTGRASFQRSSSLYDSRYSISNSSKKSSRTSVSPIPILSNARYAPSDMYQNLNSIRMSNRKSMSADDLFLDLEDKSERDVEDGNIAFPFPPQALPGIIPRSTQQRPQQKDVSPPRTSPGLSFGGSSDAVPSTPSTANMPLTPPPFMPLPPVPGEGQVGLARTFSTGSRYRKEKGHDRKRTVSSGVVMLDGVEVAAQEADEEREIVGWALESY